jgi:hypothetical protein
MGVGHNLPILVEIGLPYLPKTGWSIQLPTHLLCPCQSSRILVANEISIVYLDFVLFPVLHEV